MPLLPAPKYLCLPPRAAIAAPIFLACLLPCSPTSAQQSEPVPAAMTVPRERDEAGAALHEASELQKAGEHNKAIEKFERVLALPVPEGARPPGMHGRPFDLKGEARWGMAESLRAQGQWERALRLYRLNRKEYPRDDGCVPSGAGLQQMALAEAVCLEHLGRHAEAVSLLWPAAMNLGAQSAPRAARRLADLYAASGQLAELEAAVAREERTYLAHAVSSATGRTDTEQDKADIERQKQYSALPSLSRVLRARRAARRGEWNVLLQALRAEPEARHESALSHEIPAWQRREVYAALAMVGPKAAAPLRAAMGREPQNSFLRAALFLCTAPRQEQQALASAPPYGSGPSVDYNIQQAVGEFLGFEPVPLNFPPLPRAVRLPELPAILKPEQH